MTLPQRPEGMPELRAHRVGNDSECDLRPKGRRWLTRAEADYIVALINAAPARREQEELIEEIRKRVLAPQPWEGGPLLRELLLAHIDEMIEQDRDVRRANHDEATAELRADELRALVRELCDAQIKRRGISDFLFCAQCHGGWMTKEPEKHKSGCIVEKARAVLGGGKEGG